MQALLRSLPSQAQVLGNAVRVQLPQRAFSTLRPSLVQAAPRVPSFALCQRRFIHDSLFDDKLLNAVEISTEKNIVTKTPEERWAERSKRAMTYHAANPPPGPYHGRTVGVHGEEGLGTALKKLDGILGRNRVRQELRLTERHEKKGVKRRRLLSERWRKQFANEVRKKVALVLKIKHRGA